MPPVKTPVRLADLFRYYRGLPHQMAALEMLGELIPPSLLHRENDWFRVWSQDGKQGPPWQLLATDLIKTFEGCRLAAYLCPAGVWTIGWGATSIDGVPVKQGDVIAQSQADALLVQSVQRFGASLFRLIPRARGWSPQRVAALVSWAYNVGLGAVEGSTLRRRLELGHDPDIVAKEELPRWDKAMGLPLAGLIRRRKAELDLFLS